MRALLKKKILITLIIPSIFIGMFFIVVAVARADISTSLLGWWKFDEGSGLTASDSSGFGHTGSLEPSGTPPIWMTGKIGDALSFNGSNQYVSVSPVPSLSNPLTVTAWVYPTSLSQGSFGGGIGGSIIDENQSGSGSGWDLGVRNTGVLWFWPSGGNDRFSIGTVPLDRWTAVAVTYDGTDIRFYINGILDSTQTMVTPSSGSFLNIGDESHITGFWKGVLDDIRVYDRALAASDITQLYEQGSEAMHSNDYAIQSDSVNFGGGPSESTNYSQNSTLGEIASGDSASANYALQAGYQQMLGSSISISSASNVTLSALSGLVAGDVTANSSWNVVTDDTAGYQLTVAAATAPALQEDLTKAYFSDYTPAGGATSADYNFTVPSGTSLFGFSPQSSDAVSRFENNGSTCGTGSASTAEKCWAGFATTTQVIAQGSSDNQPNGATTTLTYEAAVGANKVQDSGTYSATITVTAVAL